MKRALTGLVFVVVGLVAASAGAQTPLPRAGWVATASSSNGSESASKAIDGSLSTRWSSGTDQTQGQWFSIDMITPKPFSQITIDPAGSGNDFTRAYQVFVSDDAVTWSGPVASGTGSAGVLTAVFPTQTARFVGIVQTGTGSFWWSIAEINVYGPGATPTIALSPTAWIATASVTGGSEVASRAIDGSLGTRWTTGTPQVNGQTFQLDMLQTQTVTKLILNADGNTSDFPRAYQVFVSNSTSNWGAAVATGTGTSALVTVSFSPKAGRFLKIVQTGSNSSWWSIAELTVFGVGTFTPTPVVLPRSGWTASASPSCSSDTASRALDDNGTTRFSTCQNQTPGQSFQLDMMAPQSFAKITLDAGTSNGDYPRRYAVYATNDLANWGTAIATGVGSTQLVTINFTFQSARYIKIVQTGTASSNWWSIHELNVYGIPPAFLVRDGWIASASVNNSNAQKGIDGDLTTRWSAGAPQSNGQTYQLDMRQPQVFNQLTLNADGAASDFPRGYQVFAANETIDWGPAIATGQASSSMVLISFPSQNARYLKIVQTGSSSSSWSIAELNLYRLSAAVAPTVLCVINHGGNLLTAYFGYVSQQDHLTIPIGPDNFFSPGAVNRHQPSVFESGTHASAVAVDFTASGTVKWQLPGGTATASASSPVCPSSAPTPQACAGLPTVPDGGCVQLIEVPGIASPTRDPAVMGRPFAQADLPPQPPPNLEEREENETANTAFQTDTVSLSAGAPQTINVPIPAGRSTVTARLRWSTLGSATLVLSAGSQTKNGSAVSLGDAGGAAAARAVFSGPTTVHLNITNPGTGTLAAAITVGVLAASAVTP